MKKVPLVASVGLVTGLIGNRKSIYGLQVKDRVPGKAWRAGASRKSWAYPVDILSRKNQVLCVDLEFSNISSCSQATKPVFEVSYTAFLEGS